jgi:hypothetical protein
MTSILKRKSLNDPTLYYHDKAADSDGDGIVSLDDFRNLLESTRTHPSRQMVKHVSSLEAIDESSSQTRSHVSGHGNQES